MNIAKQMNNPELYNKPYQVTKLSKAIKPHSCSSCNKDIKKGDKFLITVKRVDMGYGNALSQGTHTKTCSKDCYYELFDRKLNLSIVDKIK